MYIFMSTPLSPPILQQEQDNYLIDNSGSNSIYSITKEFGERNCNSGSCSLGGGLSTDPRLMDAWVLSECLPSFTEDLKELYKEIDHVHIELDGGEDVLLGRDPTHDHLGVDDDEHGKDAGTENREHHLGSTRREQRVEDLTHDQNHQERHQQGRQS